MKRANPHGTFTFELGVALCMWIAEDGGPRDMVMNTSKYFEILFFIFIFIYLLFLSMNSFLPLPPTRMFSEETKVR
jgi:hypothetical protein